MEFKVKPHTYSIILPTYNEKDNLPIIVWLIMKYMTPTKHDFEIVIVDDNSPDGTYQVAKDLQALYGERIVVKKREKKLGLGKQNKKHLRFLLFIPYNNH
jgi:dolichol-phosphate mannosyltransferase